MIPAVASSQSVRRRAVCLAWSLSIGACLVSHAATTSPNPALDWPAWRGPMRDGRAAPGQDLPVRWGESENIAWKAPLPGRGHGSPTVVGDRIYLATADEARHSQSVLCLDRNTGKEVWRTVVHADHAETGKHANSSAASPSVTCDGERLYIQFLNGGAVHASALDLAGKVLWQRKVCDFVIHQGHAASPVVHGGLVVVAADHKGGGVVVGLDRKTGELAWSHARPKHHNYTTPSILEACGRTQMVMAGCNVLTSLDPLTGKVLWEVEGSTEECVGSVTTDGTRVFASGGYPRNHVVAVVADGSGKVAWQNTTRVYVPSMIVDQGHLYAVTDGGMAVCWKSDTGEEVWKERLGGDFFASPVKVGSAIYASNVGGKTFVFEATPQRFRLLAQNQLGNEAYASPVACGDHLFLRVAQRGESRQEFLYCVGRPTPAR